MIDPVSRWLHRDAGSHGPVMLVYHSVCADAGTPAWPWALSLARFRDQLDFLAGEGYSTPTVTELLANPRAYGGRTAVITFDDGYLDNLSAWHELTKRSMKATWYMVSGSVGKLPPWVGSEQPSGRLLDGGELQDMAASGMEIGSHTESHARLPLADDAALQREVEDSRNRLQDLLQRGVDSFAYPFGAWDERCERAVRTAGFASACTTRTGWALRDQNPFRLRRVTVTHRDSVSSLARMCVFADNDVAWTALLGYGMARLRARTGFAHE